MVGEWLVVCIAGATCSGKTMIAKHINATVPGCVFLSQSDYVYPNTSDKHIRIAELNQNNYEILQSIDMERLRADVQKVLGRKTGSEGKTYGKYHRILLLDGSLILNDPELCKVCYVKIYMELTKEECWARRKLRGYPPDADGYFEKCVWPEYERHNAIAKQLNPELLIIFNGSKPLEFNSWRSLWLLNQLYNATELPP